MTSRRPTAQRERRARAWRVSQRAALLAALCGAVARAAVAQPSDAAPPAEAPAAGTAAEPDPTTPAGTATASPEAGPLGGSVLDEPEGGEGSTGAVLPAAPAGAGAAAAPAVPPEPDPTTPAPDDLTAAPASSDGKPPLAREAREPRLTILPRAGADFRGTTGEPDVYGTGFRFGVDFRIDLLRFLATRFQVDGMWFPVDAGRLDLLGPTRDGTEPSEVVLEHPGLTAARFGLRVEPTWRMTDRLRGWVGFDVGWSILLASATSVSADYGNGLVPVYGTDYQGVQVDLGGALGLTYELIPGWMVLEASGSGSAFVDQSGDLFEATIQAITGDGQIVHVSPVPSQSYGATFMLGVGVML